MSPAAYHERGRFTPVEAPDRGKAGAWPHPVIADGRLYLRDIGVLWAYDIRAPTRRPLQASFQAPPCGTHDYRRRCPSRGSLAMTGLSAP